MMITKNDLVAFLTKGFIHVSRQDYSFFTNLFKLAEEGKVTTGQNSLLNKLILKYQKQLSKQGYDKDWLQNLSWEKELIQTIDYFKQAHLNLINDKLILKTPFSKSFINGLRSKQDHNTFEWDKKNKQYVSPATSLALKTILPLLYKNFEQVILDETLQDIIKDIQQYENLIWNPTLVRIHNNFYILASNEQINKELSNYTISNSPECVYKLSQLGVKIHDSVGDSEELNFASSYSYEIDISKIDDLIYYIKSINVKTVCVDNQFKYTRGLYTEVCDKLQNEGIQTLQLTADILEMEMPILLQFKGYINSDIRPPKIVKIQNSRPVNVK